MALDMGMYVSRSTSIVGGGVSAGRQNWLGQRPGNCKLQGEQPREGPIAPQKWQFGNTIISSI